MPIEQSEAIVIKTVEFSESSLILDLFTRNFGKISGIAKGARRLKNPFESGLDLLAQITVSFIRKNSEALDLLTEAKLTARFRPSGRNLSGLYAGYYLAELLRMMTEEGDESPELYDLAVESLARFEKGDHVAEYLHRFEWGLMEYSGQRPSTRVCVHCGRDIDPETERRFKRGVSFGFLDGGVICADCRQTRGFQQIVTVDPRTIEWLDRLDPTEDPPFFDSETARVRKEIQGVIGYGLSVICGKKPRLQDLTERMIAFEARKRREAELQRGQVDQREQAEQNGQRDQDEQGGQVEQAEQAGQRDQDERDGQGEQAEQADRRGQDETAATGQADGKEALSLSDGPKEVNEGKKE